jgi:hypothetical protein
VAFVPNFTSDQSAGDLSVAIFEDTSTGYSDVNVTGRLIYLRKYDGSYLVPSGVTVDYTYWPKVLGTGDEVDIDCLDKDYCLDVTVVYYSGSSIQTSKTILTLFTGYGDLFLRQLTQAFAANRATINQKNFWYQKNKLRCLLDDAAQAVSLLNDQTIAQFCLDEAKKMIDNPQIFW